MFGNLTKNMRETEIKFQRDSLKDEGELVIKLMANNWGVRKQRVFNRCLSTDTAK